MSLFIPSRKSSSSEDVFNERFRDFLSGGRMSASGRRVNLTTAIQVATVFACCRVIGNGIAQVPFKLMRKRTDGTRLPAEDHPLYRILAVRPNKWQTSFEFRQMVSWHVELCGNAFVFINRNSMGKILELIPFAPGRVTVRQADDWTLSYVVNGVSGSSQIFPAASIWHIRGPSLNGFQGLDVVATAREAIGLSMATEESTARLHRNGVRPSGVYSVEGTLNKEQNDMLRGWIEHEMGGIENTGRPLVLDRAAKWLNTAMSGVDAQSLETRKLQIEQICSFMGVLPIKIGYADKTATFASAEEMNRAHREDCLAARWEMYEQSAYVNLLTEKEQTEGYYANFVEEGMARGSIKDTKDAILGYVNGGVLTPNEGRALLDQNPDPDPESNRLRIPANIVGDPSKVPAAAAPAE